MPASAALAGIGGVCRPRGRRLLLLRVLLPLRWSVLLWLLLCSLLRARLRSVMVVSVPALLLLVRLLLTLLGWPLLPRGVVLWRILSALLLLRGWLLLHLQLLLPLRFVLLELFVRLFCGLLR